MEDRCTGGRDVPELSLPPTRKVNSGSCWPFRQKAALLRLLTLVQSTWALLLQPGDSSVRTDLLVLLHMRPYFKSSL